MNQWLIILLIVVVVAILLYWQRERARENEQRRADEARRLQNAARMAERAPLAGLGESAREGGAFQRAADTAAGLGLERATGQMREMTADLALAAVQAAAAAHGGAVPGNGTPNCPASYPVKGDMPSRLYLQPGHFGYERTVPEVCFQSAEAAQAAGFSPAEGAAVVVQEVVAAESVEAPGGPEAALAEALADAGPENGSRSDIVAEAIAAADAGGVPPGAIRGDGGRDCPPAYPIKGNQSSMLFHEPGSPTYQSTIPEFCFSSVESATRAGYTATPF